MGTISAPVRVAIDGSSLIHPLLRRHMHNIIESPPDFSGFKESISSTLLRLRGVKSYGRRSILLWVVADGTRLESKLANADRARVRDDAEVHFINIVLRISLFCI